MKLGPIHIEREVKDKTTFIVDEEVESVQYSHQDAEYRNIHPEFLIFFKTGTSPREFVEVLQPFFLMDVWE
jgi:hypothetical protein